MRRSSVPAAMRRSLVRRCRALFFPRGATNLLAAHDQPHLRLPVAEVHRLVLGHHLAVRVGHANLARLAGVVRLQVAAPPREHALGQERVHDGHGGVSGDELLVLVDVGGGRGGV
jgi:hypothetical protein